MLHAIQTLKNWIVWGFDYFNPPQVLQNRVMRLFLGIHKFAPNAATKIEMDWLGCREKRWLNMIRLYHRINVMPLLRLPKIIMIELATRVQVIGVRKLDILYVN